ncbi:hypothetical protein R1flu_022009 [Riccia fluitans]|uniref:Uncharacterized protein n=1 Tax=Riccia fluitans TaxID=41844 RepID=A0ABD1ZQZ4_9MARC
MHRQFGAQAIFVGAAELESAGLVVGHFYNALISENLKLFATTIGQYVCFGMEETQYAARHSFGQLSMWRLDGV